MKTLLILNSKDDALAFKAKPVRADQILSINPTAEAELKGSEYDVSNTLEKYNNQSHQQTAEQILAAVNEITTYLQKYNYSEIVTNRLKTLIFMLVSAACFLQSVTAGYQKYYWYENGKLKTANSNLKFVLSMLKINIKALRMDRDYLPRSYLHKLIIKKYNHNLTKQLASNKKVLAFDPSRPTVASFLSYLSNNFVVLDAKQAGKSIFSTVRYIKKAQKKLDAGEKLIDYFYFAESNIHRKLNISEITSDNFRKQIYKYLEKFLNNAINGSESLIKSGVQMINDLQPEILVLDAINSAYKESACRALKENGGKIIFFNHATNSPQSDLSIKSISNQWARQGIVYSPYATHNVLRNPHLANLASEIYGDSSTANIYPLRHGNKILKAPHKKFKIIFAGNYLPVRDHIPVLAETPDEFANSILKLAEAISKIPEAELVIKLKKRKKECNQEAIEILMPKYDNVRINSSASFKEELADCDLVIANLTTTIDEALESWTPVLLYTSTHRYNHLPGMAEAPKTGKRSAVYVIQKTANLTEFVQAMIAAHKDTPLKQAEVAPYIWPQSADDMESFVRKALNS